MKDADTLIGLLNRKEKLVAMLAPSFPIVFDYPQIVGKLKRMGFFYVVEVTTGAVRTNQAVVNALRENPQSRFITSPCASFSRMVKTKYPHLVKYLAAGADSPMIATAKIAAEKWPEYRPVFIGPCIVKKLEANEDHPELNILVLTYKELQEVFTKTNGANSTDLTDSTFDLSEQSTRLYPISGGLADSSGIQHLLSEDQYQIVSGWNNCVKALDNWEKNADVRLLDILYCDGGCINGPGIASSLSIDDRRQKIINFWQKE